VLKGTGGAINPPSLATAEMNSVTTPTLHEMQASVISFRDARDWAKFHNPKDAAISLSLEASEVLELFQWKTPDEAAALASDSRLADELADVLYWVLLMAHDSRIDLTLALAGKLAKNEAKYPVEKSKGRAAKYTEL
jgi:NTP pyrophosphatase (non-canonical NTP hydrolase)